MVDVVVFVFDVEQLANKLVVVLPLVSSEMALHLLSVAVTLSLPIPVLMPGPMGACALPEASAEVTVAAARLVGDVGEPRLCLLSDSCCDTVLLCNCMRHT